MGGLLEVLPQGVRRRAYDQRVRLGAAEAGRAALVIKSVATLADLAENMALSLKEPIDLAEALHRDFGLYKPQSDAL